MAKEEEYEVTILSRDEIVTYPKLRQAVRTIAITYVAADLPPATIFIPKEEYSIEREKELIKKDIKRRLKEVPVTYRV